MIGTTMSDGSPSHDPDELALIEALTRELGAEPAPIEVPAAQDAALRAMARDHARAVRSRTGRGRRTWLLAGAAVACAAGLLLALTLGGGFAGGDDATPAVARAAIHGDVNRDGAVDVIDAMALARDLERGPVTAAAWDLNRDGVVDQSDVEWIASHVVALDRSLP